VTRIGLSSSWPVVVSSIFEKLALILYVCTCEFECEKLPTSEFLDETGMNHCIIG